MRRWILRCLVTAAAAVPSLEAHHSIAGVYDSRRQVTIEGVITEFAFVSPHPFLWVEVRQGESAGRWRLEMDNRREFQRIGFDERSLSTGDQVVVTGSLSRREPNRMYIQRLDRPADGFGYEQVNSRPQLRERP